MNCDVMDKQSCVLYGNEALWTGRVQFGRVMEKCGMEKCCMLKMKGEERGA